MQRPHRGPDEATPATAALCLLKAQGSHPPEGRGLRGVTNVQNTLPSSEKLRSAAIYLIAISG